MALCFTDFGLSSTAPWIFMNSPTSPRHVARPQGHGGPPAKDESHNNIFSRPVSSLQQFHSIWSRRLSSELTQRLEQNWRQKLEERLRVSSCFVVFWTPLDLFDPVTGPQWAAFRCPSLKLEPTPVSPWSPRSYEIRNFWFKVVWAEEALTVIQNAIMLPFCSPGCFLCCPLLHDFHESKQASAVKQMIEIQTWARPTLVPLKTGGKAPTDAWMHQVRYVLTTAYHRWELSSSGTSIARRAGPFPPESLQGSSVKSPHFNKASLSQSSFRMLRAKTRT